jgi:hypothetical protein
MLSWKKERDISTVVWGRQSYRLFNWTSEEKSEVPPDLVWVSPHISLPYMVA